MKKFHLIVLSLIALCLVGCTAPNATAEEEAVKELNVQFSSLETKEVMLSSESSIKIGGVSADDFMVFIPMGKRSKGLTKAATASDVINCAKGHLLKTDSDTFLPRPNEDGFIEFTGKNLGIEVNVKFKILKIVPADTNQCIKFDDPTFITYNSKVMQLGEAIYRVDMRNWSEEQKQHVVLCSEGGGGTANLVGRGTHCYVLDERTWSSRGIECLKESDLRGKDYLYIYAFQKIRSKEGTLDDYRAKRETELADSGKDIFASFKVSAVTPETLVKDSGKITLTKNLSAIRLVGNAADEKEYLLEVSKISPNTFYNFIQNVERRYSSNGKTPLVFHAVTYDSENSKGYIYLGKLHEDLCLMIPSYYDKTFVRLIEAQPQTVPMKADMENTNSSVLEVPVLGVRALNVIPNDQAVAAKRWYFFSVAYYSDAECTKQIENSGNNMIIRGIGGDGYGFSNDTKQVHFYDIPSSVTIRNPSKTDTIYAKISWVTKDTL